MMRNKQILALDACDLVEHIHQQTLSATAVTHAYQQAIADRDPQTGAWHRLAGEDALRYALAVDNRASKGALAGIPFGVKDVIDTADIATGYGSAMYEGFQPIADAGCVALTRRAGGIVLGKTVSTELAMASPNGTRNPHNLLHTPGGSSSGSCAAVAAGTALAAYGTQTSGSVIRPASYCGVVGYKPSFGLITTSGIKALSHSLDQVGIITRSVRDAALVASAVALRPDFALNRDDDRLALRMGVFFSSDWTLAQPETLLAIEHTAQVMSHSGSVVIDVPVPPWFSDLFVMHDAVMGWEVTQALAYERSVMASRISPTTRDFLTLKAQATSVEYLAAQAQRLPRQLAMSALFNGCDVLITPAAAGEAPIGLDNTGDPFFNRAWTLLHLPCLTLPAVTGPNGLPVGVQLIGRPGGDRQLLRCAAAVEMQLRIAGSAVSRH
ncbi:amidase [Acerihabitans sp. TG2]|uniref:amidase n=1 Tax=Acerihabitans sp. TG2 TaxID=3096008 RepID=UPI002B22F1F4|nr:amidase [Acerihabitans sp. TG2]MEA9391259.1 amidase [Acerihabitans sp. TG2]